MSPKVLQLAAAFALLCAAPCALPVRAAEPIPPPVRPATTHSPDALADRGPLGALGIEVGAGWMPALGLSPVLPAAHDFTTLDAGLRVRLARPAADWVLRLAAMDLRLSDGNYRGRGYDWDDTQYAWFGTTRFYYLQVDHERFFARTGPWRWSWSVGAGLGLLSGRMVLQNAQGCRAANWRTPDTDPAWGGCYHDPDPYGSSVTDLPPVMGFLHGALGLSRRYGVASLHVEAGLFLPGFFGFSVAVEMNYPR